MPTPSAYNQFSGGSGPTVPGDVTSHTFVEGTRTWHYRKAGNLYFDFWNNDSLSGNTFLIGTGNGGSSVAQINATFAHIATLIGVTVNVPYSSTNFYTNGYVAGFEYWNGGSYVNGTGAGYTTIGSGFLSN
jgi:hypothetical protein